MAARRNRRATRAERHDDGRKAGRHPSAMSSLLNGRAGLSAEMAIRFEKAFDLRADALLRMQAAHDLAGARAHERDIRVERVAA
jgi:antitoxin HigA-1